MQKVGVYCLLALVLGARVSLAQGVFQIDPVPVAAPVPTQIQLKDLDASWFTFIASSTQRPDAEYQIPRVAQSFYGGAGSGVYYSRGQTLKIADAVFLIAYSVSLPEEKWLAIARALRDDLDTMGLTRAAAAELDKQRLTPETPLTLSLLSVRSLAAIDSVMPYDAARLQRVGDALFGLAQQRAIEDKQTSDEVHTRNLKLLGLALQQYILDYDEILPPLENAAAARRALEPYTQNKSIFVVPGTEIPYQPNPRLSRKKEQSLINYSRWMVVFYESAPDFEGKRGVLFLDGHTKRVADAEWQQLKKASKIP